ncbi:holin [Nonomuraea indica]|uniref:holin n=1 Tax=Nonomuraea indica TaxID=1581193 RepID=UPI000C7C294C|nr:holin [Nonomuraea indica]
MHAEPVSYSRPKVESKVKASTAGAYLGLLAILAPLQAVQSDLDLIAFLPDWLETLAIPLLPGLVTYVSGYVAKHEPRPDLPASQR